ncbi:hypothetical protein [Chryseobacterium indologenes]|uniref:hypothetical protein n=1 Tax=Chryseobacterium indologenes TaxID=253 RepID=UPI001627ADD5|nr:hypothetical protein [Chryseobacterium indologenes]
MGNYLKLKIGGKERGLKVGIGFLKQYTEAEKVTFSELLEKFTSDTLFTLPKMIFHSLSINDKLAGNAIDYTIDDVFDWIDEIGLQSEQIAQYCTVFAESIKVHLPKAEGDEEKGKKEPQKKRQKI